MLHRTDGSALEVACGQSRTPKEYRLSASATFGKCRQFTTLIIKLYPYKAKAMTVALFENGLPKVRMRNPLASLSFPTHARPPVQAIPEAFGDILNIRRDLHRGRPRKTLKRSHNAQESGTYDGELITFRYSPRQFPKLAPGRLDYRPPNLLSPQQRSKS